MIVRVVAVGRVRDPALRSACDEYAARAGRYMRLEVREVAEARGKFTAAAKLGAEAERLLAAIPGRGHGVALTRAGVSLTSDAFAKRFAGWQQEARDMAFLIGSADGLDPEVLDRCGTHVSLSTMTLPHELARLVLLEQLYRVGTILRGEPYHRGSRYAR
jgi:23S rRNA (pseudouridine1915-N3)-methyltransferase